MRLSSRPLALTYDTYDRRSLIPRSIKMVVQNHDDYVPMAMGDVVAKNLALTLDRRHQPVRTSTAVEAVLADPLADAGEVSFSRHLVRHASGDRRLVVIPTFLSRCFMHRGFYVRRGSGLTELSQLRGRRIGLDDWFGTGNVWGKEALREAGVPSQDCEWWVGRADQGTPGPADDPLPSNARLAPVDRTLAEMLIAGDIDAVIIPGHAPIGFYQRDFPIVRLLPDYPKHERDYYIRTRVFPAAHIIGIKREVVEQDPAIALMLFDALNESKTRWDSSNSRLGTGSPWMKADVEAARALMGYDWRPYGVGPNEPMIAALCVEVNMEGLVDSPADPSSVFADFERIAGV